jgi:signal peptidase I
MAESNASVPSPPALSASPPGQPVNGSPGPVPAPAKPAAKAKTSAPVMENKDSFREIIETVVFVVVLVLLLKAFVAEAFVIPTGSMAETLYGYQKMVTCPKCGHEFPVNCSCEVDPQQQAPSPVIGATCPNCEYKFEFKAEHMNPEPRTGDRVLVGKFLYDFPIFGMDIPERYQVVVFKYPKEPQRDYIAMNYIKRLIGKPGETIAIHYGNLYVCDDLNYAEQDKDVPQKDLWQFTHKDDWRAEELFKKHQFHILRKPPKVMLAERRLVFDNDHQPLDLVGKVPPRWQAGETNWNADQAKEPKRFTYQPKSPGETGWLRYQHIRRGSEKPSLITDIMGYNSYVAQDYRNRPQPAENWVGDLMLECDANVSQASGELVLELSKGVDRFRARWNLSSGQCTLTRLADGKEETLETKDTPLKKPGKYRLRFADFDERLTVWVDNALPFGEGVVYQAPEQLGPTQENDLEPASIGARGAAVTITGLKLYRDTYYTSTVDQSGPDARVVVDFTNPRDWEPLRNLPVKTLYVQPGHFLCMGDNSPESSDGRSWGLVPHRLLLGRALSIYYPFFPFGSHRAGRIE